MGEMADEIIDRMIFGPFDFKHKRKRNLAKTQYLKFKGLIAWTRIYEGQEDEYNGDKHWKISFYPSKEVADKIKDAGIQARLKDDDGEKSGVAGKYFVFKRPLERTFDGAVQKMDPVKVYDKDGKLLEERVSIGNGSTVEVTLEVYPTKRFGKGTRLNSIRILDLIEYKPEDSEEGESDESEVEIVEEEGKKKVRW